MIVVIISFSFCAIAIGVMSGVALNEGEIGKHIVIFS